MTNNTAVQLCINKESSISSIQTEFKRIYPFLKICFLKNGIRTKEILLDEIALSRRLNYSLTGFINISKERTVAELYFV